MADIPIIFSAPMVRALLEGRKTMTRRLAWQWKEPPKTNRATSFQRNGGWVPSPWQKVKPGDRLWVRENWHTADEYDAVKPANLPAHDRRVQYAGPDGWVAWDIGGVVGRCRPSIHMPRWASRLTLIVTATKIERLQDISEEDAAAEGVQLPIGKDGDQYVRLMPVTGPYIPKEHTFREFFARLWCELHGPESWDANPEVVALTFTVHKANIDAMEKAA